jgi:hypothetical protein
MIPTLISHNSPQQADVADSILLFFYKKKKKIKQKNKKNITSHISLLWGYCEK